MGEELKVLIVEDNEDDCLLVVRELERGGFAVQHERVTTPVEMQRALEQSLWDAVICDHDLPQFSAPAALELFGQYDRDIPFIVVSGAIGEETAVACMRAGAHDYIMKSDLARLAPALTRELRDARERRRRQQAEEARREAHEELEAIHANAPVVMMLVDAEMRVRKINGYAEIFTGACGEEAFGKLCGEALRCLHHLEDPRGCGRGEHCPDCVIRHAVLEAFENRTDHQRVEAKLQLQVEGETQDLTFLLSTTLLQHREEPLVLVTIDDITERTRMEEALRESEEMFRTLFTKSPVSILIHDTETGEIVDANPTACAMYGFDSLEELQARDFWLDPPYSFAEAQEWITRAAEEGPQEFEWLNQRSGGALSWEQVRLTRVTIGGDDRVLAVCTDITDRKRAEEALRESEERYRAVFENTGTAMCLIAEDMTLTLVNDRFAEQAGWPREEIEGRMSVEDFIADHEIERMKSYHRGRREGEEAPNEYEFDFITGDGETRRVLINIDVIPGTMTSVASMLDITEHRKAEEALRESEERFRTLADMLPQVVFETDSEGILTFVNRNALEMFGYGGQDLADGINILERIAPEDRESAAQNMLRIVSGDLIEEGIEYTVMRRDGTRLPALVYASPLVRDGQTVGLRGLLIDITERKQAEEEIRRLSQFQEAALDQASTWLNVLDTEGNVLIWNRAAEEISGYPAEDVVGRGSVWKLLYPDEDYRTGVFGEVMATMEQPDMVRSRDTEITTRAGDRRLIAWNTRTMTDADGDPIGVIALGRDITEQRELEHQLRQSQKMEAVGQLAGGVAHDFNNMLTVILGNAQLLREKTREPEIDRHAQQIEIATRRSEELTRQLLAFSRQQAMNSEVVDLTAVVREVLPMLERVIPESIQIQTRLADDLAPVEADAAQLGQVLMNLCINARDAMREGGEMRICTEMTELSAQQVAGHPGAARGLHATLIVSDTGTGMSDAVKEKVFEPFFTTKDPGEGTGLGLATAYGMVKQCGGYIDLQTSLGEGTTFTIHLPVSVQERPEKTEEDAIERPSTAGGETILVVEDEDSLRHLVQMSLTSAGYEVVEAENGVAALEFMRDYSGQMDLIVTDVVMPEMSGPELIEQLGGPEATPPVLYVSGYVDSRRYPGQTTVPEGADILRKPFEPSALVARVRATLARSGSEQPQSSE